MNVHELFENAQLDALGLLDEREREEFERSLAAASPSLRAQVRREQARLVRLEPLPDAEPGPELRERVLAAIRSLVGTGTRADWVVHNAGRAGPIPMAGRRPNIWRTAAIGAITAAVVLAVGFWQVQTKLREQQLTAGSDSEIAQLTSSGTPAFAVSMLFDENTRQTVFSREDPSFLGRASLYRNPDWSSARLFVLRVQTNPNEKLRLVALDANGKISRVINEFLPTGGLASVNVKLTSQDTGRLAIVAVLANAPIHEGRILMTANLG